MQKNYFLNSKFIKEKRSILCLTCILFLSFIGTAKADIKPADTPKHTYEFYVRDKKVDTQIVLNNEKLRTVVAEPTKSESYLLGWFDEDDVQAEFDTPIAVSETKTIKLKSKFENIVYVSYFVSNLHPDPSKEQYIVVEVDDYIKGQEVKLPINIPMVDANGQVFSHWSESLDSPTEYIPGPITEHKSLYARYKKGYKISFITNKGSFVLPVYAYPPDGTDEGESLDMLLPSHKYPIRKGYTFWGWTYTEKNNDGEWKSYQFDTKIPIDKDYLLRATWTPNKDTEYLCLYMFENANDNGYSLRHVEVAKGTTGEPTKAFEYPRTEKEDPEIIHFVPNQGKTFDPSETTWIDGDKTSVRKIYYNRRTYNMSFRIGVKDPNNPPFYKQYSIREFKFKYGYLYDKEWNSIIHSPEYGGGVWYYLLDDYPASIRPTYQTMRGADDHVTRIVDGPYVHVDKYVEVIESPKGVLNVVEGKPIPRKSVKFNVHEVVKIPGTTTNDDMMAREGPAIEGFKYVHRKEKYELVMNQADPDYGFYKNELFYKRETFNISFVTNFEDVTIIKLPVLYQDNIDQKIESWSEARQLKKGESLRLDGYIFDGWYTSPEFTKDAEIDIHKTMPAHDLIVYAKWIPPMFTVRLHETTEFGSRVLGSVQVMKDHIVIASKNGSTNPDDINNFNYRKDYGDNKFLDWYRYVSGEFVKYDTSLPVIEDLDLYPVYSTLSFNLKYDAGQAGNTKPEGYVPVDKVNYAAYTIGVVQYPTELKVPEGYYFDGWLSENMVSFPGDPIRLPFRDLELTALWKKTPETNIVYKANGGVGDDIVVSGLSNNAEHTVMANEKFSREGFEFLHWSTSPDAGGDVYKAGAKLIVSQPTSPTSNVLYAHWKNTTSVRNLNLNSKLRFYPNPVVDRLYIDTEKQIQSVEVLNLTGRRVLFVESLAADNSLKVLDMSQLEAGTYIVRLVMKDGFDVLKVLKQ